MAKKIRKRRLHKVASAVTFALAVITLSGGAAHHVEAAQNGKTEVNVGVTQLTEGNVSFEVPLYYVICVTMDENGRVKVIEPDADSYSIVNKSSGDQKVAVTQISVSGVNGGSWSLTGSQADLGTSATDKKIHMTVGGIDLPAVTAGNTTPQAVDTAASTNSFYANGKYVGMASYDANAPENSTIKVPIHSEVSSAYRVTQNARAVAQFRLAYTVSPLNKDGDVMKAK